jgi:diaminohydroxyphosphoribosylaminopyrimidine deaminase/5-amino-6-(5-phosphoribosylamino)uracil reductase
LSPPDDAHWMRIALALAERGLGLTRPNPPVGAVIVRRGRIVGEGYHYRAGAPHAETLALRQAGDKARRGTLYVTLEPCSTHGRTPPCTEAIKSAGLDAVVAATGDPNPCHAGRGFRILRRAGITTRIGVERSAADVLIAPFKHWIQTGRPFVSLKLALTLDGRIADGRGRSQWISNATSRRRVQALRRAADAILIGAGTLRADDPSLLPRPTGGRHPDRVVVCGQRQIPSTARLFRDGRTSWVAAPRSRRKTLERRLQSGTGEVIPCRETAAGHVALLDLLNRLGKRDVTRVLCEGGACLASSLVRQQLVDEFFFFYGPSLLGAGDTMGALEGEAWTMPGRPRLKIMNVEELDGDILVRAVRA